MCEKYFFKLIFANFLIPYQNRVSLIKEELMNFKNLTNVVLLSTLCVALTAEAQKKGKEKQKRPKRAKVTVSETPVETITVHREDSLDACRDRLDNDRDGHFDCDDQDCQIYAICVIPRLPETEPEPEFEPEEEPLMMAPMPSPGILLVAPSYDPRTRPETGTHCRDNIDNNENGLVDCYEKSCQSYRFCRRKIYERPETPNRRPGLFMGFGIGLATPNYRQPTAESKTTRGGDRIPFDPDLGAMGSFDIGYMFLKWIGIGIDVKGLSTSATNNYKGLSDEDDPMNYKYKGDKRSFFGGAFIRLQWPFSRIVPHLDIAGGYSYSSYEWRVYEPLTSWDDIDSWDSEDEEDMPDREVRRSTYRHFTFALSPGIDFFIAKRLLAIGLKAWLPVVAHQDSSTDNTGVMITFTGTPMWRERKRIKTEYLDQPEATTPPPPIPLEPYEPENAEADEDIQEEVPEDAAMEAEAQTEDEEAADTEVEPETDDQEAAVEEPETTTAPEPDDSEKPTE
jgi:hypothetical protein